MISRIPIGIDDFRKLRELGLEYVDKSDLIRRLLDRAGVEVVLLPRPRRFGKTLNLSAAGATPVHTFAVAFDGKEVRVRSGEEG